jgi:hypothetical protein
MLAMVFQKCAKVVSRKVGEELIIVPLSTSAGDITSLFSINQTGAFIWENIDGTKTVREIKEKIIGEFKVADQEARLWQLVMDHELRAFVNEKGE